MEDLMKRLRRLTLEKNKENERKALSCVFKQYRTLREARKEDDFER